ncbi:MAG: SMC-Scp complex subunit ScpB [Acidobacteria bacterium]|nr:MAG: SMC-Scp complex subunit ScpB [Acidobacteriota bacterium]
MSLKAKIEAIIYAAEEPVTLEQISLLLKQVVLADLAAAKENAAIEQTNSEAEAATENTESVSSSPEAGLNETLDTADEISVPSSCEVEPAVELPDVPAEDPAPADSASVNATEISSRKRQPKKTEQEIAEEKTVRARVREVLAELVTDYASEDRGMEIRQVAGGFRIATKPEHHDVVRAFAKSLKPPIRLSLAALETLAVVAYKQPITAPEISEIRGVESSSVLGTLLDRKLITTAGRKQVIGRPMQYKTSKDFLLRFGLNSVNELPSMEEFTQLASDATIDVVPSEQQKTPSLFETSESGAGVSEPGATSSETGECNSSSELAPDPTPEDLEAPDPVSEIPEPQQQDRAEAADGQPQSETEASNAPETEHPLGQ